IEVPKTFMFLRSFPFVSRGLRPTFSSKSIFLVRIIPLSIQLYKDEVLGITSRGNFSFAFAITISGDHLSFSILLSAQSINSSASTHLGRRPQFERFSK